MYSTLTCSFGLYIKDTTDLTVSGLAIFAVQVGPVAVLIPPGTFIRQGTVCDSDVIVSVFSRKGPALMVTERITCNQRKLRRRELNTSRTALSNHRT